MQIIVRYPRKFAKLNLAGVDAGVRMNESLQTVTADIIFLDQNEKTPQLDGAQPVIWVEGLFPLLTPEIFNQISAELERHETVAFFTQGRPDYGIFAASSTMLIPEQVEFKKLCGTTKPQRLRRDPFQLFPLRGPKDFHALSQHFFQSKRDDLLSDGVYITEPLSTWIETRVLIAPDVWIEPNVQIRGTTTIHSGARISQGCVIENATIEANALIKPYSVITDSWIGPDAQVGPFAHIRPGCHLGEQTKVGNFVEAKKARLGKGSKASHLTYLGDTEIGRDCNIGAGTITCNYDGVNKSKTILGDRVFIGSDTQLIAPVQLGDDSYVAAGSSISQDVPSNALGISRVKQVNKPGLAPKLREKALRKKALSLKKP